MFYLLQRAIDKAKRDGIVTLLRQAFPWLVSYTASHFTARKNPMRTNWFVHIKEMDRREIILKSTPWIVNIESTTHCNLRCIMCPHFFSGNDGCAHLSIENIAALRPFIVRAGEFQLHGGGEPLISPSFWKLLEFIKETHVAEAKISVNSNGVLLTEKNRRRLLDSPLSQISFSLDAATPLTYSRVRGADFATTIENISAFIQERKANKTTKPVIHLNMLLMKDSITEASEFVRIGHTLGADAVEFWPLHNVDDAIVSDWTAQRDQWTFVYQEQLLDKADPATVNAACDAAEELGRQLALPVLWPLGKPCFSTTPPASSIPATPVDPVAPDTSSASDLAKPGGGENIRENIQDEPPLHAKPSTRDDPFAVYNCKTPWEWMFIDLSGNVRPCCFVSKVFGNLHEHSPEEIWNNTDYQELRESIARNQIPACCATAACPYVREHAYH